MTKAAELEQIAQEIQDLTESPLYHYRITNEYHSVPGEGDPNANILFIGEAPGEKEALSGRPFVGRAGKSLDELLEGNGLRREEIFITNIVKDRPPANRAPSKAEIKLYAPFLTRQINIIRPKYIATLGRFSMTFILSLYDLPCKRDSIGDLHGKALPAQSPFGLVTIYPLYHPAAVFYNRKLEPLLNEDFANLVELIR